MRDPRRHLRPRIVSLLVLSVLLLSLVVPATTAAAFKISLARITSGLSSPTQITNAGDGDGSAVRRREARHDPGHRGRRPEGRLLHGHPLDRLGDR